MLFFGRGEDPDLTLFQTMLRMAGLWFVGASGWRKALQVGLATCQTLLIVGAQLSFLVVGFKELYLDPSVGCFMLDLLFVNIELLIYIGNVETMDHFIVTMKAILKNRKQDWEVEIFDRITSRAWRLAKITYCSIVLFVIFFIIGPSVYDLYLAIFTDSSEPFIVVNFYIKYLPLVKRRDLLYWLTVLANICTANMAGTYFFTFMFILPITIAYMCAELRVIGRKLELWSEDKGNPDRMSVLGQIIREHNEILRLIEIMRKYLGLLLLPQNISSSISITLGLFSVSQALKTKDIDIVLRMADITITMTSVMFMNCYFAQDLCDENDRLSNVLHTIPWYEESPQVRRSLLLMLIAVSHKPLSIDYKGLVSVNLRMFAEMMQTSYSFFTILQSTV